MTAFSYALKTMARDKSTTLWSVAFPLVLMTLFYIAFGSLDESYRAEPVGIVVVDDAVYRLTPGLAATITGASEGDEPWLEPSYVESTAEAERLVADGGFYGYVAADADGDVSYHRDWRAYGQLDPGHEIVSAILDGYLRHARLYAELSGGADPAALNQAVMSAAGETPEFSEPVRLTANPPSDSIRYFQAALGFAALMMCNFAVQGVARLKANHSALAARRRLGAAGVFAMAAPTLMAAWLLSFATLVLGYLYLRFPLGLDFGGKDLQVVLILLVAAGTATALGGAIGSVPVPVGAMAGISATVACVLSIFAGLYGPASQELGDSVVRVAPWAGWINPAREIADALSSLYNYDTFERSAQALAHLGVVALVLFAVTALVLRRSRYEHL
ncbi:MAG: ABC transporter permease [Bifidobacteriaceae bacterium]|jgi:hypothetical protein|nr:ABC transporter permease [Bifidobacteriaceae bacterium]